MSSSDLLHDALPGEWREVRGAGGESKESRQFGAAKVTSGHATRHCGVILDAVRGSARATFVA
jgi:hypothetical protein